MEAVEVDRVRRARNGDADAFRDIVAAYSRPLWRAAWRILGDAEAAEDAVQDTFLRAWRSLDRFDDRAELSTWLYRIAINAAIDLRRERRRRDAVATTLPEDFDGQLRAASPEPDPHRRALSQEILRRAREAIDKLTEDERAAILLRHFEGRSIAEIALALGAGEGAAKQAVFRAVQKVRHALGPLTEISRGTT
jgi:RNA polymerase sigma-70 factor (ECF subfamily)